MIPGTKLDKSEHEDLACAALFLETIQVPGWRIASFTFLAATVCGCGR